MIELTVLAALALLKAGQCVAPESRAVIVGIAMHEGGGHILPFAIHDNSTGKGYIYNDADRAIAAAKALIAIGHASLDLGAGQINTSNLGWTGLSTIERAFDPCRNLAAAQAVFFAKYNGNPPPEIKSAYALGVAAEIAALPHQTLDPGEQTASTTLPDLFTRPSRGRRDVVYGSATVKGKSNQ